MQSIVQDVLFLITTVMYHRRNSLNRILILLLIVYNLTSNEVKIQVAVGHNNLRISFRIRKEMELLIGHVSVHHIVPMWIYN